MFEPVPAASDLHYDNPSMKQFSLVNLSIKRKHELETENWSKILKSYESPW